MFKHGATAGPRWTREYRAWVRMKRRCHNPNHDKYQYYGGRGIHVCERWRHDFTLFLADMGKCPEGYTLDRKDNEGNYTPENCRWTTHSQQMKNRRPYHQTKQWLKLDGQRFGRLIVVRFVEVRDQETYFLCRCDCGKEKVTRGSSLRQGMTRSCGCLRNELNRARAQARHLTAASTAAARRNRR